MLNECLRYLPHPSLYRLRGKMTPSPYAKDIQIFYVSGGEGLAARRLQRFEILKTDGYWQEFFINTSSTASGPPSPAGEGKQAAILGNRQELFV